MNDKTETPNLFDPLGLMKNLRDSNMEQWSKAMLEVVNSDTFASAQAESLNIWLSSSAPFRKLLEDTLTRTLGLLQFPTSDDITRLAERLTNVEMRLDDMDAKLDQLLEAKNR